MDALAIAQISRAQTAINMAFNSVAGTNHTQMAKAFAEIAWITARAKNADEVPNFLRHSANELVQKAGAHTLNDSVWDDPAAQLWAESFIATCPQPDILAAFARYSQPIPNITGNVLIASGAVGSSPAEGALKVIRKIDLSVGVHEDFHKTTAALVASRELLHATGEAGLRLFKSELGETVIGKTNADVIASLLDTSTRTASAGSDPLQSLRAGLLAAGPSTGYVIAAPSAQVAWLATTQENKGNMGVRGGDFCQGITVVAVDGLTAMHILPASRMAVFSGRIELRPAGHASISMADSPSSPSTLVNLWQTGCLGLICERYWRVDCAGDDGIVLVQ